jgi:maltose O-acetyltransferase
MTDKDTEFKTRPGCWMSDPELEAFRTLGMQIGQRVYIDKSVMVDRHIPKLVIIGDDVVLTQGVSMLTHDASNRVVGGKGKAGEVKIGNNVFIGLKSIILCDTRIGDNVIVGAGSVVCKDIPSNEVWAGNPARRICSLDEYKAKQVL